MYEDTHKNPRRSFRHEFARIASEVALFLVKLAVAGLVLLVDWGIKRLSAVVLEDPDGFAFRILALVLDITFVGTAIIISVTGVITIAAEFVVSAYHHIRGLSKK